MKGLRNGKLFCNIVFGQGEKCPTANSEPEFPLKIVSYVAMSGKEGDNYKKKKRKKMLA